MEPSKDWKENVAADEDEDARFAVLADQLVEGNASSDGPGSQYGYP